MTDDMPADIFIGMPVYRGERFVTETLQSIGEQTYRNFHVVMSVDGPDDPTIEACRQFTDDERFELVVHSERLGWPGNFNWIVRRCDREFFCYWQQDDPASADYLESIRRTLLDAPAAAIAYTDVQWIGDRSDRDAAIGIYGPPLERVLQEIEALHYVPLRGLVRAECLPVRADPIPLVPTSGHQQEFVYLADLAGAGEFVPATQGLYLKRSHPENAHRSWFADPDASRRDEWCALGDGLIGVVGRAAPEACVLRATSLVLDRLTIARPGRGFYFMPAQTEQGVTRFIRGFFGRYPSRLRALQSVEPGAASGFERPVHPWVTEEVERCLTNLAEIDELLTTPGSSVVVLDTGELDPAALLLGHGWHDPEPWGVWTDGLTAEIRLPVSGFRRVELVGHPFAPSEAAQVGIGMRGGPMSFLELSGEAQIGVDLPQGRGAEELIVQLDTPFAASPHGIGLSDDPRVLGFGLSRIILLR